MKFHESIVQSVRFITLTAAILGGCVVSLESASARDPRPTTYREKARHDFRDVQLGLCHPADGSGKSMKCSDAYKQSKAPPKK